MLSFSLQSSLLQLILGELEPSQGSINVVDNISYASQEPWLFGSSIRNNILYTAPYKPENYNEVVEKCCLSIDFQQLKHRDATLVGERGISLSGGQKARINLARAVYNNASLYLFDDPLSAVDANVGRQLYEQVIGPRGLLSNETRILVTHQTQYITEEADLIVWLAEGQLHSGNWQEMCQIIEAHSMSETIESRQLPEEPEEVVQTAREVTISMDSASEKEPLMNGCSMPRADMNDNVKTEEVVAEDQGQGCVKASVWWAYFTAGNSICGLIYIVVILLISQAICSGADYFVNIYTKIVFMDAHKREVWIDENLCLIVYAVLIVSAIFVSNKDCLLGTLTLLFSFSLSFTL